MFDQFKVESCSDEFVVNFIAMPTSPVSAELGQIYKAAQTVQPDVTICQVALLVESVAHAMLRLSETTNVVFVGEIQQWEVLVAAMAMQACGSGVVTVETPSDVNALQGLHVCYCLC